MGFSHMSLCRGNRLFVLCSPHCWQHSYRTCCQRAGCTPPPAPSELLRAGLSTRRCPCCPQLLDTATALCTRQGRREVERGEKMKGVSRMRGQGYELKKCLTCCYTKTRQTLTSCQSSQVCGLMLTSGLRCSLWQRQRAEQSPWCLGEVWECRLLPAPPWRPAAWSSPPPFWPCPRLFLWCTSRELAENYDLICTSKQGNLSYFSSAISVIWWISTMCFL